MVVYLPSQADRHAITEKGYPLGVHDVGSTLPIYLQLATYLRALIKTLQLQPGESIPSEPELASRFNVSRATVRQAVGVLLATGVVRRVQGKGTFLTERIVDPPPTLLQGTVEDYLYRGETLVTTLLDATLVPAPLRVANFFGTPRGESVFRIARLRSRTTGPVSYVLSYLRPQDGKRIARSWLAKESLLRILAIRLGIPIGIIQQGIEAAEARPGIARHLGVSSKAAILKIETRVWTRTKEPVDYVETYLQAGYRYIMEYEWAGIVPTGNTNAWRSRRRGNSSGRG